MDRRFFIASAQAMERSMYCIARSYLRCEADCEDALQNALLRAWEKRNTLREERYFRTWLTRILINSCKETLRRQKRETPAADFPEGQQCVLMRVYIPRYYRLYHGYQLSRNDYRVDAHLRRGRMGALALYLESAEGIY